MITRYKMIRKRRYVIAILMTLMVFDSAAQNSQVLYYMNLPQNHFLNPAMRPSNSVYIGLPGISGVDVNVNNNFFNFSDIFTKSGPGDSVISIFHPDYNVSEFMTKIRDINNLEPRTSVQLFGLGFSAGRDLYIFLDINERIDIDLAIPGYLLRLALEGNEHFVWDQIGLNSQRTNIRW